MSKYDIQPIDFARLKTMPLAARGGKVRVEDFAAPYVKGSGIGRRGSIRCRRILAADSFRARGGRTWPTARAGGRPMVWGMGGHVIKCGLAPVLIDLMRRGYATAFAMNGSAAIHDFEIALAGHTSEDVEAVLPDGSFGTAEETGREMNQAIACGDRDGIGIGEALGRALKERAPQAGRSLLAAAYHRARPGDRARRHGNRHAAHPPRRGAAPPSARRRTTISGCSARLVAGSNDGGVYLNVGSAVIMPEVFLKAVSAVRNLGHPLANFTTVNFDFLQHYRPRVNVVERPHAKSGGHGYSHHRASRAHAAAARRGVDRERAVMENEPTSASPELPVEPPAPVPPPPEPVPFLELRRSRRLLRTGVSLRAFRRFHGQAVAVDFPSTGAQPGARACAGAVSGLRISVRRALSPVRSSIIGAPFWPSLRWVRMRPG